MGLFSSIFGAKKSATTTVNVPAWIDQSQKAFSGNIGNYLAQDPHSFVAPASTLQTKAFGDAQNLGAWQAPLNSAMGAVTAAGAAPAASAGNAATYGGATIAPNERVHNSSLLDNFSAYLNPTTDALVNSSLGTYNRQVDQRRAGEQAKLAGNGAWGSGGQFYMSDFDQGSAMGAAQLENQLRSQAWQQAMQASGSDADRRQGANTFNAGATNTRAANQAGMDQTAGMFNAGQTNQQGMFNAGMQNDALSRALQSAGMQGDIANNIGSNQRADVGLTGALGEQQHAIDQAYAQALPAQLMNAGGMYGGMGLNNYLGGTNKGISTPSPFQAALSVASLFASDRRLKTNIVKVGEKPDGLGVYEYDYVAGHGLPPSRQRGVMADEVRTLRPWALGPKMDGFDSVNYSRLEAA